MCVCVWQPEASLSLRQPQISDRSQRQHCALNLFLPAGRSSRKFGGRFGRVANEARDGGCFFSGYQSLNRFSPDVTFIIFKQLISVDETEEDGGDPSLPFRRWMEGARADTGRPSDASGIVQRASERAREW